MVKYSGKVRWFNNKKGYGFIAPTSSECPTQEEVFVHQTNIVSDGAYRTLVEDTEVEFGIEKDANDKWKAVDVTGPGGSTLKPPAKRNRNKKPKSKSDSEDDAAAKTNGNGNKKEKVVKPREPTFYDGFPLEIKKKIEAKGFDLGSKTTVDVSVDQYRYKIGQGGYAGLVTATGILAEGSYTSDDKATISFEWERALLLKDGAWTTSDAKELPKKLSLVDDDVKPVDIEETLEKLWGGEKPDPKDAFEKNGFKMRRVVLTRAPNRRREQK